jgi:hypothetical protein
MAESDQEVEAKNATDDWRVGPEYQLSDELWTRIEPWLPEAQPQKKEGTPAKTTGR